MKVGITTIALTLLAGAATVGAHPQKKQQPCVRRQNPKQSCAACRGGRQQQTFQRQQKQSPRKYPAPQQYRQWQQRNPRQPAQQLRVHPQQQQKSQKKPQLQGRPQKQQFQGRPQQHPQLTAKQREHIQKMQQKFKQDVQRYLSSQNKKEHKPTKNNPTKNNPNKKKHPKKPNHPNKK